MQRHQSATGAILFTAVQTDQNQQVTGSSLQAEICRDLKQNDLKPGNLLLNDPSLSAQIGLFSVQTNVPLDFTILQLHEVNLKIYTHLSGFLRVSVQVEKEAEETFLVSSSGLKPKSSQVWI